MVHRDAILACEGEGRCDRPGNGVCASNPYFLAKRVASIRVLGPTLFDPVSNSA
jgi:hypothetical protein